MKKIIEFLLRANMILLFINVILCFISLIGYAYTNYIIFIIFASIFAIYPIILIPRMLYYAWGINKLVDWIKNKK